MIARRRAVAVLAAPASSQAAAKCAIDSVKVGAACVDRYEASVWSIPAASTSLIKRVQKGKATLAAPSVVTRRQTRAEGEIRVARPRGVTLGRKRSGSKRSG